MKENSLYFIPLLAKAYDNPDRAAAFKDALTEIIRLGKRPEYQEGFEQFEQFIETGLRQGKEDSQAFARLNDFVLQRLLHLIASDSFDGPDAVRQAVLKRVQSDPILQAHYQALKEEIAEGEPVLEVELYKNEVLVGSRPLPTEQESTSFDSVEPGNYSLKLSNGRVLWEGEVEAKDVVWKDAFPEKAYPMAAATQHEARNRTRSVELLKGEMVLAFYAGLESGNIQLRAM